MDYIRCLRLHKQEFNPISDGGETTFTTFTTLTILSTLTNQTTLIHDNQQQLFTMAQFNQIMESMRQMQVQHTETVRELIASVNPAPTPVTIATPFQNLHAYRTSTLI